jgi:DNA polymerase delta subunit 1
MTTFQAVAWEGSDHDGKFVIRIYGRQEDGKSVALGTTFRPYFYAKLRVQHNFAEFASAIRRKFQPTEIKEVHAKDLWGFQNNLLSRFARIEFDTMRQMRFCAWALRKDPEPHVTITEHTHIKDGRMADPYENPLTKFGKLKVYETNIDPVLRFMHVTGIRSTGWLTCDVTEPDFDTTCDINLWAPDYTNIKPVDRDDIAPLKIMSFDIECYSKSGSFPNPMNTEDCVFQIGMTTRKFGSVEPMERMCLCLKETAGPDTKSFDTEKKLLQAFEKYLIKTDPDIITGWNIFGFDLEFLQVRAVKNGLAPTWGRFKDSPIELVTKNLSSSALGNNMLKMVPMRGRYVFDLFQDVKREHKLESYSLNNVSKHFLKDQKNDMPVKEIFSRFAEGDATRLGEVADYCLKDTELPHKLLDKLCQIQNLVEMAKACWVPLAFLSERGQQIKVFSQMAYKARELNFIIPTFDRGPSIDEDKYQGATVLEAQTGAYYSPITALDFASLYPSIMCAHNLCYSTLVMDPRFDNLPGVVYEQFGPHRFAQNVPSLLPVILTDLKAYRKKAKKLMAQAEGTPMEAIYNGQQLAYKISMNSIYGFTGASKGMLPLVAIASTVTMRGRQMIEETKTYVEEHFPGAKVRYGDTDSVMVEFDVQGRKGQEAIDYSWQLGEQAAEQCTKLFKAPNDLELEKVYCPYFLYSKKRYAAKMYEKKGDAVVFKKIDVKGLQVVRRDSCPYVRDTLKQLLNMVLESDDPKPAVNFAKQCAKDLKGGLVPIEKLLLSKQLADGYKITLNSVSELKENMKCLSGDEQKSIEDLIKTKEYKFSHEAIIQKMLRQKDIIPGHRMVLKQIMNAVPMPHVQVRNAIRSRAPGSEPQQGDRVQFVIVEGRGKMFEKAEDPAWVTANNLKIDYEYYFDHQLKKPVCDLLEPLVGPNPEKVIFAPRVRTMTDFFSLRPGPRVE